MGFIYYLIGMVISFVIITLKLYYDYKDKYYVSPNLKGILKVLDRKDILELYVCGIILYPISLVVILVQAAGRIIKRLSEKLIDSTFAKTKGFKVRAGKIALLKVGDEIRYIKYLSTAVQPLIATIIKVSKDEIEIEYEHTSRTYPKKDIVLWYNELLIDLSDRY